MRLLGIETSCDTSSVALVEDGRLVAERLFPARMSLCQTLSGHVQDLLGVEVVAEAGLGMIAVSLGPGSFTGLRMGVALAKSLAHALSLPLMGIPTQEALAWQVGAGCEGPVWVLQHARNGEVYAGAYRLSGSGVECLRPLTVLAVADIAAAVTETGPRPLLVGDGVARNLDALREALGDAACFAPPLLAIPHASTVATLAFERLADADPDAWHSLRPIYAMASQAERSLGIDLGTNQ